jgi:hypothetical protein
MEQALDRTAVRTMFRPGSDLIRNIAENLIEQASGVDRDLLSKSLQETLLYITGLDPEIDYFEIKTRLGRFLSSHGKASLIEQFLSFCIFNFVWFYVGESFQDEAGTVETFEKDMESVEQVCQRIVASTWRSYDSRQLDTTAAGSLIRSIETQLRSDSHIQAVRTRPKKD